MRLIRPVLLLGALLLAVGAGPASASSAPIRVAPKQIDFGTRLITEPSTDYFDGVKITNASDTTLQVLVQAGLPDDFGFGLMPGSTCPVFSTDPAMAPRDSCRAVVRFTPTAFFAGREQSGSLVVTATDPTTGALVYSVEVPVTGTGRL